MKDVLATSSQFGHRIIQEANALYKEKAMKTVVAQTEQILAAIREGQAVIGRTEQQVQFLREKIAAIESGRFEIDRYNFQMVFKDERFNR